LAAGFYDRTIRAFDVSTGGGIWRTELGIFQVTLFLVESDRQLVPAG